MVLNDFLFSAPMTFYESIDIFAPCITSARRRTAATRFLP
jgi:hypothetical protein